MTIDYAGVRWDLTYEGWGGGPGYPADGAYCIDPAYDPILLDPDEWYNETTAYPFTLEGVVAWANNEGADVLADIARDAAQADDPRA